MPLSISRDPKRTCDSCGQPRDCFYVSIGDKSNAKKFRICQPCYHTMNVAYVEIVSDSSMDSVGALHVTEWVTWVIGACLLTVAIVVAWPRRKR